MAETRKHRVEVRDALDRALLAAMGDPVRPIEPGSTPAPTTPDAPAQVTEAAAQPLGSMYYFTTGQPKAQDASESDAPQA